MANVKNHKGKRGRSGKHNKQWAREQRARAWNLGTKMAKAGVFDRDEYYRILNSDGGAK